MASSVKTRTDLKSVFNDVGTLLFQSSDFNLSPSGEETFLSPEFELPVHVDDLTLSQDAPNINHYKVIGLDGDWVSSSESGDFNVNFFVPTSHSQVYMLAYGSNAVTSTAQGNLAKTEDANALGMTLGGSWAGFGVNTKKNKVTGYFALINAAETHAVLIRNASLYATIEWNNTSTDPVGIRFTGTIENDGGATIVHLIKGGEK